MANRFRQGWRSDLTMEPVDVYANKERARTRDLVSSASRVRYGTQQPIPPSSFNQAWGRVTDRYNRALSKIVPVSPAPRPAVSPYPKPAEPEGDPRLAAFDSIKNPNGTPVREADVAARADDSKPVSAIAGNLLSGNRFVRTVSRGHVNLDDLPGPLSTVTDVALAPATLLTAGAGGVEAAGGRAIAGAIFKRGVEETAAGVAGLEAQKEADKLPGPLRTPVAVGAGLLAVRKAPRIFQNGAADLAARAAVGAATGLATREAPGAVAGLAAGAGAFKGIKAAEEIAANPAARRAAGRGFRAGLTAPATLSTSMIHVDDPHFAKFEDALARHNIEYRIGEDGTIEVVDPEAAQRVVEGLEAKGLEAMQGTRVPGGNGPGYQPPFGSREREAVDEAKIVAANRRSIEGRGGSGKATMPAGPESGLPDPMNTEAYQGLDDAERIGEVLDPESYPDTVTTEGRRTPIAEGAKPKPAEPITPESIGKKRAAPKDLAAIQSGVDEADTWLRENVLTPQYTPRTASSAIQAEIDRRGFLVGRETRKKPLTNTELAFRRRLTEVADDLRDKGHEAYTVGDELPGRADTGNVPVAEGLPGAESAGGGVPGEAGGAPAATELPADAASPAAVAAKRGELLGLTHLDEARELVRGQAMASPGLLQRRLKIGYVEATKTIDALEAEGVLAPRVGDTEARAVIGGGAAAVSSPATVKRVDLEGNVLDTFQTEAELNGIRAQQGAMDLEGRNTATFGEPAAPSLTPEAQDLLRKVETTGVPFAMTNNLRRIATENGIDPSALSAAEVVDALKAKIARAPEVPHVPPHPLPPQGVATATGESALKTARPATPERPPFQLPAELAGAKPTYSYGPKRFKLQFDDEADKALYIVASSSVDSKRHNDYLAALSGYFPDRSPEEIRQLGNSVKARIKALAKDSPAGNLRVAKGVHELGAVEGLGPGPRVAPAPDAVFGEPKTSGANTPPAVPAVPATEPPPPPEVGVGNPQRAFGQTEEPVDLLATRPVDELLGELKAPKTLPENRLTSRVNDRIRGVADRVRILKQEKPRLQRLITDMVDQKVEEWMAKARDSGLVLDPPADPTLNGWMVSSGGHSAPVSDVVEGGTEAGRVVRATLTPDQEALLQDVQQFIGRVNGTEEFHGLTVAKTATETGDFWPREMLGKRTEGAFIEKNQGGGGSRGRVLSGDRGGARTQVTQAAGEEAGNVYGDPWTAIGDSLKNKLMNAADARMASIVEPLAVDAAKPGFGYRALRGKHPLLSGKQVTGTGQGGAAFLVDKPKVFPNAIADQIDAVLSPSSILDTKPGKAVAAVNAVATPARAAADTSSRFNQGLGFFESSPRNFAKASAASVKVAWSAIGHPEAYDNLIRGEQARTRSLLSQAGITGPAADEYLLQRGFHYATPRSPEEFVFPQGLEKIPLVGKVIRFSNDDFTRFTNYARWTLANDELERAVGKGLVGDALAREVEGAIRSTNRMTGWTAANPSGIEALGAFAPRFFRSTIGQVAKAFTDGGIEGQVARRHLLKLFGIAGALTYGVNSARNYTTDLDPRSNNFLRIRNVGGQDISLLGPFATLIRGAAQTLGGQPGEMTTGPRGHGFAIGTNTPEPDPGAIPDFIRAKASPALSTAWTLIKGKTFDDRPIARPTEKEFYTSPKSALDFAREQVPFAVQAGVNEGIEPAIRDRDPKALITGAVGAGLSALGAQTSEVSPGEKRDIARESVAKELFGSSYEDLAGGDKAKVNADPRVERNQREVTRRGLESNDKRTAVEQDYRTKLTGAAGFLADGKDASGKPFGGVDYRKSVDDAAAARSAGLKALGVAGGDDLVGQYFGLRDKATMANGQVDYDMLDRLQAEFTAAHPDVLDQIDKQTGTQDDPTMQSLRVARKQAEEYYQLPPYRGLSLEEGDRANAVIAQAKALTSAGQAPTTRVAYGMLVEHGDATEDDVRLAIIASRAGANPERKEYRATHPEFARFYYNAADDLPQTFTEPTRSTGSRRTPTTGGRTSNSRIRGPGRAVTTGRSVNRVRQPGR